jgi:hypothetical protein
MDILGARVQCLKAGLWFLMFMATFLLLFCALMFFDASSLGLDMLIGLSALVSVLFAAAWLLSGGLYTMLIIVAIALSKNKLSYKALWILVVWLVFFVGAIIWEFAGRKSLKLSKKYSS